MSRSGCHLLVNSAHFSTRSSGTKSLNRPKCVSGNGDIRGSRSGISNGSKWVPTVGLGLALGLRVAGSVSSGWLFAGSSWGATTIHSSAGGESILEGIHNLGLLQY